jgi:hypothetical protein
MDILHSLERIASFILGVGLLVAYLAWKWKRAGEGSEALTAERLAARQSFEQLTRDPRFFRLQQYVSTKYRTTFDPTADPVTYRIRSIALWDSAGQRLFAQNGGVARWLIAYLERGDAPARIQVSLDLQNGVCGEAEVGRLAWSGVVVELD